MNWKLILQLSMFGLAMGLATVFFIPSKIEPVFWLIIFIFCAYSLARHCRRLVFVHGLLLGIANSVWITAAHILFASQYLANHLQEAAMMKIMPFNSPQVAMALMGPGFGIVSGIVIGLFAWIASKMVKPEAPALT